MKTVLRVAVGVIKNAQGEILIALRDRSVHQGGLWEFPGGKIERDETVEQALARELKEELDIDVEKAVPLISIDHDYADLSVRLKVCTVERFRGHPKSVEGQPLKWVEPSKLKHFAFPEANWPILSAARLPPYYAILDDRDESALMPNLEKILAKGIKLIQARIKSVSAERAAEFIDQAHPLCRRAGASLLINSSVQGIEALSADGVHLTGRHLRALSERPKVRGWVGASCHNAMELQHAQQMGVDFAVLAPVMPTATHPDAEPLGLARFSELVAKVNLPVYALGGLSLDDLVDVRDAGGQGIAGISAFLD
ncbi:MAG: Nudix family hydrolase [Gammaproteobacteria bacterium]